MRVGVVGLIVPLSQSYTLLLLLLQFLWQSPLTHPHLLVPRPDIVALLHLRLVNTETRFSSMSRIVMDLVLAGIWGGVSSTDNTQNINTTIRAQAELAIIKPFWCDLFCCSTSTFAVY